MRDAIERKTDAAVGYLAATLPDALHAVLNRWDTCILNTRIGVEVLRRCGLDAKGFGATLSVINPHLARKLIGYVDAHGHEPDRGWMFREGRTQGSWGVGIGFGGRDWEEEQVEVGGGGTVTITREYGFDGHCVLRSGRFMADLSLYPAARPERDIVLPKGLTIHGEEVDNWFSGTASKLVVESEAGSLLWYEALPKSRDREWLSAPDWNIRPGARGGERRKHRRRMRETFEALLSGCRAAIDKAGG